MAFKQHEFVSPKAHVCRLPQAHSVGSISSGDRVMSPEQLPNEQPLGPTEVRVKNTFIHVEDVVGSLPRSKSDGDLSNASTRSSIFYTRAVLTPGVARSSNMTTASAQAAQSRNETGKEKDHSQAGEWSVGAAKHNAGHCKPCTHYSNGFCRAGRSCRFCHFPHQKRNRPRPNRAKRAQAKAAVAMIGKNHPGSPAQLADDVCRMGAECGVNFVDLAYLRKVVASRAASIEEQEKAETQPTLCL